VTYARAAASVLAAILTAAGHAQERPELVLQAGARARFQTGAALSADSSLLAVLDNAGGVALWNVQSRKLVRVLPPVGARAISVSGDGSILATADEQTKRVSVLHSVTREPAREVRFAIPPLLVACSDSGESVAAALANGKVVVVRTNSLPTADLGRLAASPTALVARGELFAAGDDAGNILFWRSTRAASSRSFHSGAAVRALTLSPDGARIAAATAAGAVEIFRASDGKRLRTLDAPPDAIAMGWGDQELVLVSESGGIASWSAATMQQSAAHMLPLNARPSVIAPLTVGSWPVTVSSDARWIAVGTGVTDVALIDSRSGEVERRFETVQNPTAVAVSAHGLVAIGGNRFVMLWEPAAGTPPQKLAAVARVRSLAFDGPGSLLAVGTDRGTAVWDVVRMKRTATLPGGGSGIAFAGDHLLAVESRLGVALHDLRDAGQHQRIQVRRAFDVQNVTASAQARIVASRTNNDLQVTHLPAGKHFAIPMSGGTPLTMTRDGSRIAVGFGERVSIIAADDATTLATFDLPGAGIITALAFDEDGSRLAAGGDRGAIAIRDATTGAPIASLGDQAGGTISLAFLDCSSLLSASADGTVHLWDTTLRLSRLQFVSFPDGEWVVVTGDGLFDGSARALRAVNWWDEGLRDPLPLAALFGDFYFPGLAREVVKGRSPKACVDLATRLRITGLRTMLQEGIAYRHPRSDGAVLCFRDRPGGGRARGRTFDPSRLMLEQGFSADCPLFLPLTGIETMATTAEVRPLCAVPHSILAGCDPAREATWRLLTIGIDEYPREQGVDPLCCAASDADVMALTLERLSARGAIGPLQSVRLRNDTADGEGIRAALRDLASAASESDVIVLYMAGHGDVPAGEEMFYFLPFLPHQHKRTSVDLYREYGINTAEIADALRHTRAQRIVVVVDACDSGGVVESLARLASLRPEGTVVVLAAGTPLDEVPDGEKYGGGVLTSVLAEELWRCGGECSLSEILASTYRRIPPILAAVFPANTHSPLKIAIGRDMRFANRDRATTPK
jgi:WD40 repeat protein